MAIEVTSIRAPEIVEANGQFLVTVRCWAIIFPSIVAWVPPTNLGTAYEPKLGIKVNSTAVIIPGLILGIKILKNACPFVAPKSLAASIREKSNFSITAYRGKIANGKLVYTEISTTALVSVSYTHLTLPTKA